MADSPLYFAWLTAPAAWSETYAREDESVYALEISQTEGQFAEARIDIENPGSGLLAPDRDLWVWLSYDSGSGIVPLFHGRLVAVPGDLSDEVVKLTFRARPDDYEDQKAALADTLRVLPWWDPIFVEHGAETADSVLESRSALWHIDRTTLAVTASDAFVGDSVIDIAGAHFYDDLSVEPGAVPIRRINAKATVTWPQRGEGIVDITNMLQRAFDNVGSSFGHNTIASLTGDGLLSSWPKEGDSFGGGWTVALGSQINADLARMHDPTNALKQFAPRFGSIMVPSFWQPLVYTVRYIVSPSFGSFTALGRFGGSTSPLSRFAAVTGSFDEWTAIFPVGIYNITMKLAYKAERKRIEVVTFAIESDVQPVVSEPGATVEETLELTSDFVGEPVDPGGGVPIGDLRRNTYFKTNRGLASVEHLILKARARLLMAARAVTVNFAVPWGVAVPITCRHSCRVPDYRLPGGAAIGKVISYRLLMDPEGGMRGEFSIGCMVGHGGTVTAAAGTNVYAADGYMQPGYQQVIGAGLDLIPGEIWYETLDDFDVIDDGLDLFRMTPERVVQSIVITGGLTEQHDAIQGTVAPRNSYPSPMEALKAHPTHPKITLVPMSGSEFTTTFAPDISLLMVPRGIDLEAP